MALANYGDLKAKVASWLHRADLATVIPDFVTLFEAEAKRTLESPDSYEETTLTTTGGTATIVLPADFARMASINKAIGGTNIPLPFMTPSALDAAFAGYVSGEPRAYTIEGTSIRVAPVPDGAYDISMAYYASITPLVNDGDTNWLLTRHPDFYLYGTLAQSAPFLGNDPRLQTWATLAGSALESINSQTIQRQSGAVMQTRVDGPTP